MWLLRSCAKPSLVESRSMPRMELCEIHDDPRFPALLRDLVTDALQSLWDFSNSYKPILPLLRDALAKAGTIDVVDLCSGAGGPWFGLVREFDREYHFPIHVCLTDKYPNRKAFEKASSFALECFSVVMIS